MNYMKKWGFNKAPDRLEDKYKTQEKFRAKQEKKYPNQAPDVTEGIAQSIIRLRDKEIGKLTSRTITLAEDGNYSDRFIRGLEYIPKRLQEDNVIDIRGTRTRMDRKVENPINYYQYQTEAIERFADMMHPEKINKRLDELKAAADEREVDISDDMATFEKYLKLFQEGDEALQKEFGGMLLVDSNPLAFLNIMAPLLIGMEREVYAEHEAEQFDKTIVEKMSKKLLFFMSELARERSFNTNYRHGLCITYAANIQTRIEQGRKIREAQHQHDIVQETEKLSDELEKLGIVHIFQEGSLEHRFLRLQTKDGQDIFWDPTIMRFIEDEQFDFRGHEDVSHPGFIGTADELRKYIKTATREGRIKKAAGTPDLAYERYWNYGGAVERQEMDWAQMP